MNIKTVLAFDVYGTLIDTTGVYECMKKWNPEKANLMVEMWRNKQLEYSFRQSGMGFYKGFSFCTKTSLDYTCKYYKVVLNTEQKNELLKLYNHLPVFDDVETSLIQLKSQYQLYAFSNGEPEVLKSLLDFNKISEYFQDIISVESTMQFKPSPEVYAYFNKASNTKKENTFLVSSNPFDIIGASYFGLKTIWLKRNPDAIFDNWGIEPNYIITNLKEITTLNIK